MTADFLKISGNKIVDENGNAVQLKGVNLGGWLLLEPGTAGELFPSHLDEDGEEAPVAQEHHRSVRPAEEN